MHLWESVDMEQQASGGWYYAPPPEDASRWQTILWWEKRRIPYNVIVIGVGLVSLLLMAFLVSLYQELEPGEDLVEPILLFLWPILMNICYTAGWVVRVIGIPASWAPALLRLGTLFSLFVVCLPTAIHFVFAVASSVGLY